jgi:hypothetical protein
MLAVPHFCLYQGETVVPPPHPPPPVPYPILQTFTNLLSSRVSETYFLLFVNNHTSTNFTSSAPAEILQLILRQNPRNRRVSL